MAENDRTVSCNPNKRFRPARSVDEEAKVLAAAVPKTTEYKNRWAVKLFEDWKTERDNTHSSQEYSSLRLMEVERVENLNTSLQLMKAESINFWLGKFVQEVRDQKGQRYPGKTLYQIIAALKRYLANKGRTEINLLSKTDTGFAGLRQILDAEMKDVHREGIKNLKNAKQAFSSEEEQQMWQKGVLGNTTAKILTDTIYFYNGKIFGLRAGEHRIIRPRDFVIGDDFIQYTENASKTHQGGLLDLKKNPRVIKHFCEKCSKGEEHTRCLVRIYRQYLELVECLRIKDSAYYFQAYTGKFELKNIPVGIHSLNNIVPLLCEKACLERRTSHCLRVTCASRLFNENQKEELIRGRTGHTSDALFRYEKPNRQQELEVSNLLGPPESEDELCLTNESEVLGDNIDLGEVSKTENDISEFDELMEDYLVSQELLNIELPPVEKAEKVTSPKKETFQPVNISNCSVSINYYNHKV